MWAGHDHVTHRIYREGDNGVCQPQGQWVRGGLYMYKILKACNTMYNAIIIYTGLPKIF